MMASFQSMLNQLYWIKKRTQYTLFAHSIREEIEPIHPPISTPNALQIGHIAMYTTGNAGDTLLPLSVRDAFDRQTPIKWQGIHAHRVVNQTLQKTLEQQDGILIGGGGLFLRDTNPNRLSGWQWSCSLKKLAALTRPIALFAVGYNRFRDQADFKPIFRDHLQLLAEKSVYLGLRNRGSIAAIKSYLCADLHEKIRYQPCPTTLCHTLYPTISSPVEPTRPMIALNIAFDRIDLRLGSQYSAILETVAHACKKLSTSHEIAYYAHTRSDLKMLPYLERAGVCYRRIDLFHVPAKKVVEAYLQPHLVIGMRGHAQMIPFGCTTPILSLISHDKMRWFLEDIERPEWGVEMSSPDLEERIVTNATDLIERRYLLKEEIVRIQQKLKDITQTNTTDFLKAL